MPRPEMDDAVDAALALSWLGGLSAETRQKLIAGALLVDLPAGATFYRDEDSPRLGLVVAGSARVFLTSPAGRQLTVRYARRGDVVGVPTVIGGPVNVSAQALADISLLLLHIPTMRAIAMTDANVAWALAEEVTRRLYAVLEAFEGNMFATVRQRVVRHVLDLAADRQRGTELVAVTNQQQLADAVGTAREVVARTIHDLRAAGLIKTVRNRIVVIDPAGLADVLEARDM